MNQSLPTRRDFVGKIAAASLFGAMQGNALPARSSWRLEGAEANPKNVLFVYGGYEGHEPKKCAEIFIPWLKEQKFNLTVSTSLDSYLDAALMQSLDLIIETGTMGTISEPQVKALLETVKNGAGLAGWHGGLVGSFLDNFEYNFMTGGRFAAHPGGIIDYEVNIKDHKDPVTAGLRDFKMHSEQYYLLVDPHVKVLATTTFSGAACPWIEGCVMPSVWKKMYGKGRVFYSAFGHVAKDFDVPEVLEITKRGILWASESKRASQGVK